MPTLNSKLQQTTHRSVLRRKASNLELEGADDFIRVAVDRGCHHFQGTFRSNSESRPVPAQLSDEELVVLLIHGENEYSPMAIRCAAQLLKKADLDIRSLTRLARMERVETTLNQIAGAGLRYDSGDPRWETITRGLQHFSTPPEAVLPAPERYLILQGRKRYSTETHPPHWPVPQPR